MKKSVAKTFAALGTGVFTLTTALSANEQPTSNMNPAYAPSNVQAQLRLDIGKDADVVHFVRDTNDPQIITKTYLLKHADPYSIRPYLREMVQAQKVSYNNPAGRENPYYYNVYSKDNAAKTQKIYVPCGIECVKFMDGTGLLIVSAEAYRFEAHEGALGIDGLVEALDKEGILNSSGQPKYIYFPVNRSAQELASMVKLVGANVSNDTVELIGGKDKVETDSELNCIFLNTALYSRKNIEEMLKIYDVPHTEVKIKCTVYEYDAENDGMLGVDFQSWKNNNNMKFLNTGANLARNYNVKDILSAVTPDGTVNTHYFNFQPEWNSRFLDFLVSKGKARIVTQGELSIQNGSEGHMEHKSGLLYAALEKADMATTGEGNSVTVKDADALNTFTLDFKPEISEKAVLLKVGVKAQNIIGYKADGSARTSAFSTAQTVTLGTGMNKFYMGGLELERSVSTSGGVPILKDIPVIGWIFSTERESLKKTRLAVVAETAVSRPDTPVGNENLEKIELIKKNSEKESPEYGYSQWNMW